MRFTRPPLLDLLLAIGLAVLGCVEAVIADHDLRAVVGVGVACLALGWVRVAPIWVAVVVLFSFAVLPAGGTTLVSVVPFIVSMGFVGRRAPLLPAAGVVVAGALVLGLTDIEGTSSPRQVVANLSYYLLISGVLVGVGQLLQFADRREQDLVETVRTLDEDGGERERVAIAAERARMSRELHDVVAHALTIVGIHAAVARTSLESHPSRAAAAIDRVERAAEQASDEMRRLLGILREGTGGSPLPRLADLDALVDDAVAAGLTVMVDADPVPESLPPGIDLAAYRIVQEALTNARRHAPGATVRVRLAMTPGHLTVEVVDDGGSGIPPIGPDGSGHGLAGVRERARLYGGHVEIGPGESGGYRVWARIPVASTVADSAAVAGDRTSTLSSVRSPTPGGGSARPAPDDPLPTAAP